VPALPFYLPAGGHRSVPKLRSDRFQTRITVCAIDFCVKLCGQMHRFAAYVELKVRGVGGPCTWMASRTPV
jgi:hypothetical protein